MAESSLRPPQAFTAISIVRRVSTKAVLDVPSSSVRDSMQRTLMAVFMYLRWSFAIARCCFVELWVRIKAWPHCLCCKKKATEFPYHCEEKVEGNYACCCEEYNHGHNAFSIL